MNCISFPRMFNTSTTLVSKDLEATKTCLQLLLLSEQGTFKYDPFFGTRVLRYAFEQNNYVLRDILIDDIYNAIRIFCPQIQVEMKNINIYQEKNKLKVSIKAKNKVDYITNTFDLVLYNGDENQ